MPSPRGSQRLLLLPTVAAAAGGPVLRASQLPNDCAAAVSFLCAGQNLANLLSNPTRSTVPVCLAWYPGLLAGVVPLLRMRGPGTKTTKTN